MQPACSLLLLLSASSVRLSAFSMEGACRGLFEGLPRVHTEQGQRYNMTVRRFNSAIQPVFFKAPIITVALKKKVILFCHFKLAKLAKNI